MNYNKVKKTNRHFFFPEVAEAIGVDEAIMLNHLIFWIVVNKKSNQTKHLGRTWTYNSVVDFKPYFPYWSTSQIRRILKSLVDKGIIIEGNFNKSKYDKTKWYALNDEKGLLDIYNPFDDTELWEDCYR
tara:strand:+ start:81 stop:467 length:387 start_codon:yes stop_codon:yes gene_type:complete